MYLSLRKNRKSLYIWKQIVNLILILKQMKYKIVIPSYNRAETLANKSIKILQKHNIDPKNVHIFVASEEEKLKYKQTLPQEYKNRLIVGVKGMKNVRNFINDYFSNEEKLFHMDDDLVDVYYRVNEKKLEPIQSLDAFIKLGFSLCLEKGAKLFSVYPVENPYFMKSSITRGLTYCMGGFWGSINQPELKVNVDNKEDFERSIQYFVKTYNSKNPQKGGIIRFNNICCGTKGYSGAGGMQSFDRGYEVIMKDAQKIVQTYSDYCKLNLSKKSGKPEIKIKQIKLEEIKLD